MLKCGIIGLPNVGKSTLFNALTSSQAAASANYPFCTIEPNVGIIPIEDERLHKLAAIARSEQIIPSTIEFVDIAGLVRGASNGDGLGNKFLSHIREVDAIIHLLRCFENDEIIHVHGAINPLDDAEVIETELILADLESIAKRMPALEKKAKNDPVSAGLIVTLNDIRPILESGKPARIKYNEIDNRKIRQLNLLTTKPILYVCNVAEEDARSGNKFTKIIETRAVEESTSSIIISANIEAEIAIMTDAKERMEFLETIGLDTSGLSKIAKAAYSTLALQSYFTIGPKEARSWAFVKGSSAPQAAGIIHSDFEHGFICAEIITYDDYVKFGGEIGAKASGKMRTEGKQYVMQDGDVVHFRFNV